jgi:hypothetical protein
MTVMREGRAPSAGARLVRPPAARVLGESLQVVLRSSEMERGVTARANHLGPWRLVSDRGGTRDGDGGDTRPLYAGCFRRCRMDVSPPLPAAKNSSGI